MTTAVTTGPPGGAPATPDADTGDGANAGTGAGGSPSAPARPAAVTRPAWLVAGRAVAMLAVATLGFTFYLLVASNLQERRTQDTLYKTFRGQLAQVGSEVAPVSTPIPEGVAVAIVEIPRLHVRQVVVEGTTSADLTRGPGHRRNTPLPGQPGTAVIYGRRATYGAPFRGLTSLRGGDTITTTTGLGVCTFRVLGTRDGRDPVPAVTGTVYRLSLVTSAPSVSPTHTVIVTSELVGRPAPAGGARPGVYADERALAGEPSAAVPLLLWAQALLLATGAVTFLFQRWDRTAAYLLGTPVLLAVLWNVYENLARLLPNLL